MKEKIKKSVIALIVVGALVIGGAAPAFATVQNVGGGTWNYGTADNGEWRDVWSNYVHNSYKHSSTAIAGAMNVKDVQAKIKWSNAHAWSKTGTRSAFWATY